MKSRKCSGVSPATRQALIGELCLHAGIGHRLVGDPVQRGDDLRRRARRRDHAVPVLDQQIGHADFRRGRHVGRGRRARRRAERDRPQRAGLDMRQDHRQVEERHLHLLAEQIVDRGRRAAIGHMHDVDLGGQLEQFAGEMRQAAEAGGGEIELAGLRLGERDQFAMFLAGTLLATTSISGTVTTSVTGAKSLRTS